MRTPFRKFSKVSALLHHEVKLRVRALFFFLRMCACPICAQWYTYSKTLSVVAFHSKCARELTLEKLHQGLLTCRFFSLSLFLCTYILTVYIYTYMNGSCGQPIPKKFFTQKNFLHKIFYTKNHLHIHEWVMRAMANLISLSIHTHTNTHTDGVCG